MRWRNAGPPGSDPSMGRELNTSTFSGTLASLGNIRRKFSGRTPATTAHDLPKRTDRPTIAGSDEKCRVQTACERIMVRGAFGASSSELKKRPSAGLVQ